MKEIEPLKDVIKKYEPKEVVHYCAKELKSTMGKIEKHIQGDNLNAMLTQLSYIDEVAVLLKELDEKMNGKKGPTVV